MENQRGSDVPEIEDYGSPSTDADTAYGDRTDGDVDVLTNQGTGAAAAADRAGEGSNFATNRGDYNPSGENRSDTGLDGGQFGEFGDTGVGTDLTMEMENTDVRSGLVKGGEHGADDVAGPGQYGGETGGLGNKDS